MSHSFRAHVLLTTALCLHCALASASYGTESYQPDNGFESHQAITIAKLKDNRFVLLGQSFRTTPKDEGALWLSVIDGGVMGTSLPLSAPVSERVTSTRKFDRIIAPGKTANEVYALFYVGDDNLHEIQTIDIAKNKVTDAIRLRLPKDYGFGNSGPGSGGIFKDGAKYYAIGVSSDRNKLVVAKGDPVGGFNMLFEHKTAMGIGVIDVIDDVLFLEIGDAKQNSTGESRIETIVVNKPTVTDIICKGKSPSLAAIGGNLYIAANLHPTFPMAEHILNRYDRSRDFLDSMALSKSRLAVMRSIKIAASSKNELLVGELLDGSKLTVRSGQYNERGSRLSVLMDSIRCPGALDIRWLGNDKNGVYALVNTMNVGERLDAISWSISIVRSAVKTAP